MNRKSFLLILLALVMCLSLVSCGDKEITKLTIDEGLAYTYDLNSTPDFSAVKATVTYNDDSTVAVTADDLTFGKIDTTTAGKKELTITYNDFTITVEVTVKGASLPSGGDEGGDEDEGVTTLDVYAAELPANITLFNTNSGNNGRFTTKGDTYKVGNANPFKFTLSLLVLDENDTMVTITQYTSASVVTLNGVACTSEYVTIDEENNTFQFTAAAVGKTFVISTRPANIPAEDVADYTKSLTVEVVAGYNVTNAKELNLMTNKHGVLPETQVGAENQLNLAYRQVAIVKEYVDQQFGQGYYDTYGGDDMKGIVLHCDLAPTTNDIPAKYLTTDASGNPAFDDAFEVYTRELYPDSNGNTSFDIYGNYFTINTEALPLMTNDPTLNGGLTSSNAQVFNFECWFDDANGSGDSTNMTVSFDYKNYPVLIENIAFKNGDPNSNNAADNEHHKFALAGIRIKHVDITMDNTIMEAFSTSMMLFDCNTELTIKDSIFNNAWMTHLYARAHNDFQNHNGGPREQQPYAGVTPIEVNLVNSSLTKCGGPVIMTHSAELVLPYNASVGLTINADTSTEMWSYVQGTEAWFQAYSDMGAMTYATLLQAISGAISNTAADPYGQSASLTTTREGNGDTQFLNIVICSLSGITKYNVNETVVMDNTDAVVSAHKNHPMLSAAPLIQSTVDPTATATWLGPDGAAWGLPQDKVLNASNPAGAIDADFFAGDYVNFHYPAVNISVVLGYYHPAAQ